jgi:hypothetical protein
MKTILKLLVLAAAFGLAPSAALAQANPNAAPTLTEDQKASLPAQPESVSAPGIATGDNPSDAEVATKAIEPSGRSR